MLQSNMIALLAWLTVDYSHRIVHMSNSSFGLRSAVVAKPKILCLGLVTIVVWF